MPPIQHAVLRGAVLFTLTWATGCHDSPLQPHPATPQRSVEPSPAASRRTLSGRAADSLMSVLETHLASQGHPEYRETRVAWRKLHGVPERIRETGEPAARNAAIAELGDGTDGTLKPSPRIISHYEKLYFGRNDEYFRLPTAVNAEMTFVGDVGDIQLGSLTITRNSGSSPYQASGRITAGSGQLLNCLDGFFAACGNEKYLGGMLILDGAPVCDARGSGNVNYYANNVNSSFGTALLGSFSSSTPGGIEGSTSSNGSVDGIAPACVPPPAPPKGTDGGEDIGGNGTNQGDGSTAGGTPGTGTPESWPPPPSPYDPSPTGPVGWDCSGVVMSQLIGDEQIVLAEAYVCRPIYY